MERALWMTDQAFPLSVVVALAIQGPALADRCRSALDELQSRHGALRVRIGLAGRRLAYFDDPARAPVTLEVRDQPAPLRDVCTELLNGRVDPWSAPLMDAVLLDGGSAADRALVVRFHHAMVDGWVVGHLLEDLLGLIGGGTSRARPGAASDSRGKLAIGPIDSEALRCSAGKKMRFLSRELVAEWAFGRATRNLSPVPAPREGSCRAHARSLSAEDTARLMRSCRRDRVTLQGAISGALLLATHRHAFAEESRPMRAISFADLRAGLGPEAKRSVGAHVGMLRHVLQVRRDSSLNDVATACTTAVARSMRNGDGPAAAALSPLAMRRVLRRPTERMADTALSYLGPIGLSSRFGDLVLTDVQAYVSGIPLGPLLSGFGHLFERRLALGFMTMSGDMQAYEAERLVDDVLELLSEYAGAS